MARPRNQERQRRTLLDAATSLIAESGPGALSARQVAARAGVSPATVMYYYPRLDELVAAVHHDAVRRFCVAREEIAARAHDPAALLPALVSAGLPTGADDTLVVAVVRMLGMAGTDQRHARAVTGFWDRQVGMFEQLVTAGTESGAFTPRLPGRTVGEHLVALEDAYGIQIVSGDGSMDRARALELVCAYAEAVLDCPFPPT